jgi:DNA topoisomerase I
MIRASEEAATDPAAAARAAGLRYADPTGPGIRRVRAGRGFTYRAADGRTVRSPAELRRIRRLAIPPAWTDVWISPNDNDHLQATGRDARGRKQYRYHDRWREVRDTAKYARLLEFARTLPGIRARVRADLRRDGLSRERVLATVVRLLEETLIRVGNDEYARANRSFGLTTLRDGHVAVHGSRIRFRFRGKSGIQHEVDIDDRRLARIVRQLDELPGQLLFQYVDDDGAPHPVGSDDVNAYLRDLAGDDVTAKDFRTWAGTVLAARALAKLGPPESETEAKRNVVVAIDEVARRLRNTRAICRKCYVHPAIVEAYSDGSLFRARRGRSGLDADERWVARIIRAHTDRERKAA